MIRNISTLLSISVTTMSSISLDPSKIVMLIQQGVNSPTSRILGSIKKTKQKSSQITNRSKRLKKSTGSCSKVDKQIIRFKNIVINLNLKVKVKVKVKVNLLNLNLKVKVNLLNPNLLNLNPNLLNLNPNLLNLKANRMVRNRFRNVRQVIRMNSIASNS